MNSLKDELANAKPFLHAYEVSPFFNNAFISLDSHNDSEDKLPPERGFSNRCVFCSLSKKTSQFFMVLFILI